MKCIVYAGQCDVVRTTDVKAAKLVDKGVAHYAKKSEWKQDGRKYAKA